MKLSKKGEYALQAMTELAESYGSGPRQIKSISAAAGIPVKFLEQILLELKKADLLRSRRGAKGGYSLAADPSGISLADIIIVTEGNISPIECVTPSAVERCPDETCCGIRSVMREVGKAVEEILSKTSLEDLAARSKNCRQKKLMYHI